MENTGSEAKANGIDTILKRLLTLRVVVIVLVVYLAVYALYTLGWLWFGKLENAGLFGDMFGVLNAFASGIAMFGVIVAILLQRQQNQIQAEELADTRRELAGQRKELEKQNAHAAAQLEIATSRHKREVADYIQRNKPVVFCDRSTDGRYVVRNVGGGFAINVYFIDKDGDSQPIALGSLAANDEQEVSGEINALLQGSLGGRRFIIIAEAPFTRTTQWTPTLNHRTPGAGGIRAQVSHSFPEVKTKPPRGEAQSLSKFLENNLTDLSEKLIQFATGAAG